VPCEVRNAVYLTGNLSSDPSSETGWWVRVVAALLIVTVRTTSVAGANVALPT